MSDIKEVVAAENGEAVPAVSELRLQPRVAVLKMNEGPDICILEAGPIMVGGKMSIRGHAPSFQAFPCSAKEQVQKE